MLYGEANVAVGGSGAATAKILIEALGNTIGNRYLNPVFPKYGNDSWQNLITFPGQFDGYPKGLSQTSRVKPELDAASDVFAQTQPVNIVPNAACF